MTEQLRLELPDGSPGLAPLIGEIEHQIRGTFADASALLALDADPVDVLVRDTDHLAIPQLGIGGYAPDKHTILISIDSQHPSVENVLEIELRRVIAHELNHVVRHRSVGYGSTLWTAIVSEGLADHFSVEIVPGHPPSWSTPLTGGALARSMTRAAGEYDDNSYDHDRWFFGEGSGYAIGWNVIGTYLQQHPDLRASDLARLPAETFRSPPSPSAQSRSI